MELRLPVPSKIRDYFDESAGQYAERSALPLWRWQRNRELAAVRLLLGELDGLEVLDLGCGAGFYTRYCLQQGARRVLAVDFSPRMVEQLPRSRVTAIVADAKGINLDNPVPKIVCAGLLEFVDSPEEVLTNARRLVVSDGTMVCLVPPDNLAGRLYRKFHQRNDVGISLFSEAAFGDLASRAGWTVDKLVSVFPYTSVFRLMPG